MVTSSPQKLDGMLNLDTHILIHALAGSCSPKERKLLRKHSWGISTIVLWELAKLTQLGRITLDLNSYEIASVLDSIHKWPLSWEIARQSTALDFAADPADEIIVATSVVHEVPLLTRDKKILKSKMVTFAV